MPYANGKSRSEYNREYYRQNRERILLKVKENYWKDPEKKKAYLREYLSRPEIREKMRRYNKEYAQRPEVKERDRERKKKHRAYYRKYHLEYYHRHKERINAKRKK